MSDVDSEAGVVTNKQGSQLMGDGSISEPNTAHLKSQESQLAMDAEIALLGDDEGKPRKPTRKEKALKIRYDMEELHRNSPVAYYITWPATSMQLFFVEYGHWISRTLLVLLVLAWFVYLAAACVMNWSPHGLTSLVCTIIVLVFVGWELLQKYRPNWVKAFFSPMVNLVNRFYTAFKWTFIVIVLVLVIAWVAVDTIKDVRRILALVGVIVFVVFCVFTSAAPAKINWRPVFWGLGAAFFLGIFVLRTEPGNWFFSYLSDQVAVFLEFAQAGAQFVFGDYANVFAFSVLPVVCYFAAVVAFLYYIGFMEYIIKKMGWLMSVSMKTSGPESMVAAGNIFLGQTESPLMIKPFLAQLTDAEILSVMTSGFASIAGSVLAAFILMGIPSVHLITACVISAPVSLAVAKLTLPEQEKPVDFGDLKMAASDNAPVNVVAAISQGTSESIPLVANIAAMLISFISILEFLDAAVGWLGDGVDVHGLSITQILGYLFYPVCFLMGIPNYDCGLGGELVAYRLFVNEFAAFGELSAMKALREEGEALGWDKFVDGEARWLDRRSEDILTYALAGFANFGSCGMMIGCLGSLAPNKAHTVANYVLRALFAANMSCFIRGSIAGMMIEE